MADLKFADKNNQKKKYSIFASGDITYAALATPSDTLFVLPRASLVTNVYAIVTDAAGVGDTLDVLVGTTVVADEIAIATLGVFSGIVAKTYFPTGGVVTCVAGVGAALADAATYRIVVEYVEIELANGTYTV